MHTQYSYYRSGPPAGRNLSPKKRPLPVRGIGLLFSIIFVGAFFVYHTHHTKAEESRNYVVTNAAQKAAENQAISTKITNSWKSILANKQDSVDIAVYDHQNGETAHYTNASGTYNTASIVKLSILEDLLLQDQKHDETLTSSQLAEAEPMIENSDNDAATALWNLDGGTSALNSFFHQVGTTNTTAGTQGYWGLTQTTALDQLKVVNEVAYLGTLLTASSANEANNLMNSVEPDQEWGVSGGVPNGVSVQLKNGWLQDTDGWDINSIGHVHGDGVDYTIAVLTDDNASEQSGIDTIQDLSTATWNDIASVAT